MWNRILIALGVLLLVGGGVGYYFQTHHRPASVAPPPTAKVDRSPLPRPSPKDAGWKELPLQCRGGQCQIPVAVLSRGACFFGDFDLIKKELSASPGAGALLSLEAIDEKETQFQAAPLKLPPDLETTGEFVVPVIDRHLQLGIFLCKDALHSGRCRQKQAVGYQAVLADYKDAKHVPVDRTYFFEPVVLYREQLFVPDHEDDLARPMQQWTARADFISEGPRWVGKEVSPFQLVTNVTYGIDAALHSLTALPQQGRVQVVLPKQKTAGCGGSH